MNLLSPQSDYRAVLTIVPNKIALWTVFVVADNKKSSSAGWRANSAVSGVCMLNCKSNIIAQYCVHPSTVLLNKRSNEGHNCGKINHR